MVIGNRHARIFKDAEMVFDESNDGVERCSAFCEALIELMRVHKVTVAGHLVNLRQVEMIHNAKELESGWRLDMQDIQSLTDGKKR